MNRHGGQRHADEAKRRSPACAKAFAADSTRRMEIRSRLDALAGVSPLLTIEGLVAGYGAKEILHSIDLRVGRGQSLCLIGPSGAGKSTLLHAIFGLADIRGGRILVGGRNITRLGTSAKLKDAGVAYVLQDCSLFPDMTVEQNLWLGGDLMDRHADAREGAERVFNRYPVLAARRREPARTLCRGERRLLEISRAMVIKPSLLLVDEPSTGIEPMYVEHIFDMLRDLRDREGLTLVMVEQNARKGLEHADIGCVVVSGMIAVAGTGAELLRDPTIGRFVLGS